MGRKRRRKLVGSTVLCWLVAEQAGAAGLTVLERYPVCEVSAALPVPCLDGDRRCVWVGDNEHDKSLFEYAVAADGRLAPSGHWKISLGKAKVGDVEALAADGRDVLVFGSHSRDSRCGRQPERATVARVEREPLRATLLASGAGWTDALARCEGGLIEIAADDPAAALRRDVCAAIADAEAAADAGSAGGVCRGDAFNVEGAVTVPGVDGTPRVWLGLRGPLAGGRAVLLRLVPGLVRGGTLTFDGVALVDLGGRGVRELTLADGSLWGIAGSVADSEQPSRLWRMPASALASGATITAVEWLHDALPPTSEGLVVEAAARRVVVLADGDTDKKKKRCAEPARQLVLPLP